MVFFVKKSRVRHLARRFARPAGEGFGRGKTEATCDPARPAPLRGAADLTAPRIPPGQTEVQNLFGTELQKLYGTDLNLELFVVRTPKTNQIAYRGADFTSKSIPGAAKMSPEWSPEEPTWHPRLPKCYRLPATTGNTRNLPE